MTAKGKAEITYGAKLGATYKRTLGKIRAANDQIKRAAGAAFSFGARAGAAGFVALGAASVYAMHQAGKMQKSMGKFGVVFKQTQDQARAWAEDLQRGTGESRESIIRMAADLGDLLKPMGFTEAKALSMSQQMVGLATDLASFNGLAAPDVLRDIQSILSGSSEPALKYGVVMKQAQLNAELMAMGIKKGIKAATEQQLVQARLNLLLKGTSDAQGAAARDGGKWENQIGRLTARAENLAASIGEKLIPVFGPWFDWVSDIIDKNEALIATGVQEFVSMVSEKAQALIADMGGLSGITEQATAYWDAFNQRLEQAQPWIDEIARGASFLATVLGEGIGMVSDFALTVYTMATGAITPAIEGFKTLGQLAKWLLTNALGPLIEGFAKVAHWLGIITDEKYTQGMAKLQADQDFGNVRDQADKARLAQQQSGAVMAEQLDAYAGRSAGRLSRIRQSAITNYGQGMGRTGTQGIAQAATQAAAQENGDTVAQVVEGVKRGVNQANRQAAVLQSQNVDFAVR